MITERNDQEIYYVVFIRKYFATFANAKGMHSLVTWRQAKMLCTHAGGYLPSFTNAKELNSFIVLIKLSRSFPVSAAIYIGLLQRNKVNHKHIHYKDKTSFCVQYQCCHVPLLIVRSRSGTLGLLFLSKGLSILYLGNQKESIRFCFDRR